MQKKQKIILTILILFVLAAIIFFFTYSGGNDTEETTTATSTATTTINTFQLKTESLTDSDPTYDISVEYPQFVGVSTGSVEDRINGQFKRDAQGIFEETSGELKQAAVGMEGRDIVFERTVQNDKTYINNATGIMSVVYSNYTDTGGAHGTFFYSSESIDVKTGEKVVLKDLFTGMYVAPLIEEIKRQITSSATTCLRCDRLKDELNNLDVQIPDNFVLSDQGITFLYGAYDLGSYAATAGGQEVFVDKEFLKEYILRNW